MQACLFVKIKHDLEYFAYIWFIKRKFELEQIQQKKLKDNQITLKTKQYIEINFISFHFVISIDNGNKANAYNVKT